MLTPHSCAVPRVCGAVPSQDMSAAQHADVLFVKLKENGESDLANYCDNSGIKNIKFQNFSQALPIVQSIVAHTISIEQALAIGDVSKG
jgi:2-hydroxy-3-keto-5-methylthiopentenyl-1-phosphate phosphatase